MKNTIVIVGGSGFIGTKLSEAFLQKGYAVRVIDLVPPRIEHERLSFVRSNMVDEGADVSIIDGSFAVINLAGVTIGRRWTASYKKKIYDSRISTTQALVRLIGASSKKPEVLVSASAVGYYGNRGEEVLTEDASPGTDFLAHLCVEWEREALHAEMFGVRVVRIRTANVLGPGGLLAGLEPLFRRGLGGYFGSGRQYMPWVHWEDIVGIYMYAIEHPIHGAFNACAEKTPSQKELFKVFAHAIYAPIVWPIPYSIARVIFGGFADVLVASQNTDSEKIRSTGYIYKFEDLSTALKNIYPNQTNRT